MVQLEQKEVSAGATCGARLMWSIIPVIRPLRVAPVLHPVSMARARPDQLRMDLVYVASLVAEPVHQRWLVAV